VQVRDRNYLIPVDADIQREDEVTFSSVDVNLVLEKMESARGRVNLVILDACRNNPFQRSFRSATQGLAAIEAPTGTLIAYATAPGRVASDGAGRNSIYTAHLLEHLRAPGLPVELMFKRVREGVTRETNNAQVPWESSSLQGDFTFFPTTAQAQAAPAPAPLSAAAARDEALAVELAFFDSIKASSSIRDYEAYLAQYPQGRFAALARARIQTLTEASGAVASRPSAAPSQPVPSVAVVPSAPPTPAPPAAKAPAVSPPPAAAPTVSESTTVAALKPPGARSDAGPGTLPGVGSRWTYRHRDGFRSAADTDVVVTLADASGNTLTDEVTIANRPGLGVTHRWDTSRAEFITRTWGEAPLPDFSPYLQGTGRLEPGANLGTLKRFFNLDFTVPMQVRVVGREQVKVPAGTFDAIRVTVTGQVRAYPVNLLGDSRITVWYDVATRRFVKYTVRTFLGLQHFEEATLELVRAEVR